MDVFYALLQISPAGNEPQASLSREHARLAVPQQLEKDAKNADKTHCLNWPWKFCPSPPESHFVNYIQLYFLQFLLLIITYYVKN